MIQLNTQPVEKRDYRDDGSLEIVGEPWATIQGEGPFAGRPAVFVRTAGCDLCCPLCDTDYTTDRRRVGYVPLVADAHELLNFKPGLIVLTGGEPFRQNLEPLVSLLLYNKHEVQIETNGTMVPEPPFHFPFGGENVTVVCSPKTPTIHPKLERWIKAYKYVLDAENVAPDGLPVTTLGNTTGVARPHSGFRGEVFLQPADPVLNGEPTEAEVVLSNVKAMANIDACVKSCMRHGYRLSIQLHKVVGVK